VQQFASGEERRTAEQQSEGMGTGPKLLLAATLCTTFYSGLVQSDAYAALRHASGLLGFDMSAALPAWYHFTPIILQALAFSLALLGILFAHEMGHYLTARRLGVKVSFPVFLPSLPPFGTLGAFIRMESRQMPANSLMRVAAWGPFAGIFVAVPVLIIGLMLSDIRPLPVDTTEVTSLGSCLLMHVLEILIVGEPPPGTDIYLHPVAFAGWAGCFVTALNLLPIGQLDGGHVVYALVGQERSKFVAMFGMLLLLIGSWFYLGWAIFGLLVFFVLGWEHPPITGRQTATGRQRWTGWFAVLLFVLTLAPIPIHGGGLRELLPELSLWLDMQL
jgi:Zn-dependent protease